MRIVQVDAFAEEPFTGNPAAVCLVDREVTGEWMQRVAAEMNLSETAFLRPRDGGGWELRWFTPEVEVDLCGHATLASAHALWELNEAPAGEPIRFHTRSGVLTAAAAGNGLIELDFPATPPAAAQAPAGLAEALGAEPVWVGRTRFDYLVELAGEGEVRSLAPDYGALRRLEARGVIVTAAGSPPFDFVSRFFAPSVGVDEDPVTGSAHCALAPFWGGRLGKAEMTAYQASPRGGAVSVRLAGSRVVIGGRAVTVLTGELHA